MNLSDLNTILLTTGLPVAYGFFPKEEGVVPPCITYELAFTENFGADDRVYSPFSRVDIFLFQKNKGEAEADLEDALDSYYIYWEKTEAYESDEGAFQTIYEVKINGK